MAQLVVRNIEDDLKARLQRRAARHGRSMEAEVRDILRDAVKREDQPSGGLGTEMAALFEGIGLDDSEIKAIEELWRQPFVPVSFEE